MPASILEVSTVKVLNEVDCITMGSATVAVIVIFIDKERRRFILMEGAVAGVLLLNEPFGRRRLAGAAAVAVGIIGLGLL